MSRTTKKNPYTVTIMSLTARTFSRPPVKKVVWAKNITEARKEYGRTNDVNDEVKVTPATDEEVETLYDGA